MVKKYPCPCCGFYTYKVPANEDCGFICPVCFGKMIHLLFLMKSQAVLMEELH